MIDKWFKTDIEKILNQNNIAVLIDQSAEAEFLLDSLSEKYKIYRSTNELDELHIKYQIEKNERKEKCIIYTQIAKLELSFIREYCETNGNIEIIYFQNYIKEKLFDNLNININLEKDELISIAKISIGKTNEYWQDIHNKGTDKIFDLEKELIQFLHTPDNYSKKLDPKVRELFFKNLSNLTKQDYIEKPAATIAQEIVDYLFNSLLNNKLEKPFTEIYFLIVFGFLVFHHLQFQAQNRLHS